MGENDPDLLSLITGALNTDGSEEVVGQNDIFLGGSQQISIFRMIILALFYIFSSYKIMLWTCTFDMKVSSVQWKSMIIIHFR